MSLLADVPILEPNSSDQTTSIEQRIRDNFSRRIHNFRIEVVDDGLVLQGRTKTYYGKQEVLQAVGQATNLPIIANNIVVG